jgi:hypothetical protein
VAVIAEFDAKRWSGNGNGSLASLLGGRRRRRCARDALHGDA